MDKTKEEHQLRIILSTLLRERAELNRNPEANIGDIEDIIEKAAGRIEEEYGKLQYSKGFEACRKKVEEGVKEMPHSTTEFGSVIVLKGLVIKTIKEIKE